MMRHIVSLACFVALAARSAIAFETLVRLDYASFQGTYDASYNLTYWKKIPFAAPPVGKFRFRAPQPPIQVEGIFDSNESYDLCPQQNTGSEDCLYLGIWGRPWTRGKALRPVALNLHGGGFVQGGGPIKIPPDGYPVLNVSQSNDIVFVYSNYRLNAFGFLPGKEVAEDPQSDLNAGLLDQAAVLRWVQRYIREFGGDPDQVTIWGQSAGGASTVAHAMAAKGKTSCHQHPAPFRQALVLSPFWQRPYLNSMPEAQARYDRLVQQVGCSGFGSLQCLKEAQFEKIRAASLNVTTPTEQLRDTFAWGPVIGGEYLSLPLSKANDLIALNTPRIISFFNTHEGESFIPTGFQKANDSGNPPFNSSIASFDSWLIAFLPYFTSDDLDLVKSLYPPNSQYNEFESYNDTYSRAGHVYRDVVLACPAYWAAAAAPQGNWLSEYMLPPAKHSSEFTWYKTIGTVQQTDPTHYKGYVGMLASYFITGDPNTLKLTADDVAPIPSLSEGKRYIVDKKGFTTTSMTSLNSRCDFWKKMASKIPL